MSIDGGHPVAGSRHILLASCNATAGVIVRRARCRGFVREVVSGLQLDDEQDRGSGAQPDIAGISTRDAECMLSAGEEQNYKALSRTLREGKGDCPRDSSDCCDSRDIESTVQAK